MATTTKLALPYPLASDAPAGPTQLQALAQKLDDVVSAMYSQSGTAGGTFAALNTVVTINVTYPKPYAATVYPSVTLTGWGGGANINYSVTAQSATGFTISTQKTAGALGAVNFNWNVTGQI